MNIWIVTKYASSLDEGFESRPFSLAKNFAKKNHNVTIISSDSNHFGNYPNIKKIYNIYSYNFIKVLRIRTLKYTRTASVKRVFSWLDFELKLFFAPLNAFSKPDVIIVSSLSLLSILNGIRLKKIYNSTLIHF